MTKVLIVEDNGNMRRVIRTIINDLADVFECCDGAQAIAAYALHHPDWVLMDIKMAGMNGIAATQAIKARWPAAKVVMVTEYNDAALRKAAHRAGASEYVVKENLLMLREILSPHKG